MVKITDSSKVSSSSGKQLGAINGRCIAAVLLIAAVVAVTWPGPTSASIQSPPNYRITTLSAGANPSAAKIGDLDGDGLNDIAVVTMQGNLELFFNSGTGAFQRVSLTGRWPANSNSFDIDIGDLNRDGLNDIAVAFATQLGDVSVLLNQGNRTFASPVNYNVCNSSRGVAIGDFDRDGANDLADISQCNRAGILRNDGHGRFTLSGTYGNGSASKAIVLADFNRDGSKDIAYVNSAVVGTITVVYNNGNGTFGSPVSLYAGDLPDDLAVGDFDGDGTPDIAIANSYYSQVILLFNDNNGSFLGYSELNAGDTPTNIATGDFNGDGLLDLAVTSWGNNRLSILTNRGDYSFAGPFSYSVGQAPVDIAVGALDGDALPDLVAVNKTGGSITVLLSTGGAPPPPPPPPPPPITLTLSTHTTTRARLVDVRWNGATSSRVDIYRNGSRIATVSNSGSYTDQFDRRARGTFRYKVCAAGAQTCSSEATISF